FLFEAVQDEVIDGVDWPRPVDYARQRRPPWRDERPVFLPFASLLDPAANELNLPLGEFLARFSWWHSLLLIQGRNPAVQLTFIRFAGGDSLIAAAVGQSGLFAVEP